MQKVWFKSKYFYGCSRYPECTFSAPVEEIAFNKEDYAPDFNWDQPCPKCGSKMKIRHGKFGAFLGCTNYPECKGIVNIPKKGEVNIPAEDMPACPAIGCPGQLVARRSRFGKTFYSCSTFPECDVILNSLDQIEEKYFDHPRTPYVKKNKKGSKKKESSAKEKPTKKKAAGSTATKKPKAKRASPERALSKELKAVVGSDALPRAEVLKKVWDYIRSKGLQDPANKRLIRPDAALGAVFGTLDPVDMMKLPGLLGPHMSK